MEDLIITATLEQKHLFWNTLPFAGFVRALSNENGSLAVTRRLYLPVVHFIDKNEKNKQMTDKLPEN